MKTRFIVVVTALCLVIVHPVLAQKNTVTCTGILIDVDMKPNAPFPMAVIYDNSDIAAPRTCVLDLGDAGHWPLRGTCNEGEKCRISGPYFKKIGQTYYMRTWTKAETPE